jgi:hypothetical protein
MNIILILEYMNAGIYFKKLLQRDKSGHRDHQLRPLFHYVSISFSVRLSSLLTLELNDET